MKKILSILIALILVIAGGFYLLNPYSTKLNRTVSLSPSEKSSSTIVKLPSSTTRTPQSSKKLNELSEDIQNEKNKLPANIAKRTQLKLLTKNDKFSVIGHYIDGVLVFPNYIKYKTSSKNKVIGKYGSLSKSAIIADSFPELNTETLQADLKKAASKSFDESSFRFRAKEWRVLDGEYVPAYAYEFSGKKGDSIFEETWLISANTKKILLKISRVNH